MNLSSLLIRNFRLLEDVKLSLSRGMHLFLGLNAQGKTSLIEAILFLSTSTSHRTRREEELIRWGQEAAYIKGMVEMEETSCIECGLEKKRKQIKIDHVVLPRVKDLYGHLRTVLFAPEDLAIIDGSPQERRRFLDMAIAQLEPSYISCLQEYRHILKQRNHVLKRLQQYQSETNRKQLEVWNQPFLEKACQILLQRKRNVDRLVPLVQEAYDALADDGPLRLEYPACSDNDLETVKSDFLIKMERAQRQEIERGSSHVGPHRDELLFYLGDNNLALFGSQGQRRAAVLALRLAQAKLCFNFGYGSPILLIDDVVYEMDNTRRSRFWEYLNFSDQMIVAATDKEHLGPGIETTKIFKVQHGKICVD